jgi:GNAT superfamily N-acetyltransferase
MSRVRSAQLVDGVAIGVSHAAAWEQAYGHIFDAGFLRRAAEGRRIGWPHTIERLLRDDNVLLVGELEGRVVAFGHAGPAPDQPRVAEIYGFYSHPVAWGSGLASELLGETCSTLAIRWDRVVLWMLREATRARRFYEKSGFEVTGGQRVETLTEWTTDTSAQAPAVEYAKSLRGIGTNE